MVGFRRQAAIRLPALVLLLAAAGGAAQSAGQTTMAGGDYSRHFRAFLVLNDYFDELQDFFDFLKVHGVADVVPVEGMWRQGSAWRSHEYSAYAMPPRDHWIQIVKTLQVLQQEIIPAIGPVIVQSGFRTRHYNLVAGGASRSQHLQFAALDLKPQRDLPQRVLHRRLRHVWKSQGREWNLGLGLYSGTRFHIDTGGYRSW